MLHMVIVNIAHRLKLSCAASAPRPGREIQSLVTFGYLWLPLVTFGYLWLPLSFETTEWKKESERERERKMARFQLLNIGHRLVGVMVPSRLLRDAPRGRQLRNPCLVLDWILDCSLSPWLTANKAFFSAYEDFKYEFIPWTSSSLNEQVAIYIGSSETIVPSSVNGYVKGSNEKVIPRIES